MNNQGRNKQKIEDNYKLLFWSMGGIFIIIFMTFIDAKCNQDVNATEIICCDTLDTFDKKQIIKTKQDIDYTGTTQGEMTEEEMLSQEPDFIYYDTVEAKREADSVDAYMEYWYTYLDTNSNGDIDDTEGMECGDSIWK